MPFNARCSAISQSGAYSGYSSRYGWRCIRMQSASRIRRRGASRLTTSRCSVSSPRRGLDSSTPVYPPLDRVHVPVEELPGRHSACPRPIHGFDQVGPALPLFNLPYVALRPFKPSSQLPLGQALLAPRLSLLITRVSEAHCKLEIPRLRPYRATVDRYCRGRYLSTSPNK